MKQQVLKQFLGSKKSRQLGVILPLVQAAFALLKKKPKRALLLVGVALVSSRSTKLGTVAQVLLKVFGGRGSKA
ncbi:hypothetical protein C474_12126 [Halogeometricum pallidum JCM 14848]|uniref:Uncharacterized protein n=1 Tax=Halogeometricum pallidum JCM 14848 TaxID=1227487 RepID=M0D2U8_HALPD|nr:hypothetical protein [Halogeometricum pallidum]ELZ29780.1 hypothetical protein C474_12126 [Halogeometricum pallidum JCM 14848]